jgi:hypothetical protein
MSHKDLIMMQGCFWTRAAVGWVAPYRPADGWLVTWADIRGGYDAPDRQSLEGHASQPNGYF